MMKPFALKHFLNYAIEHCGDTVVSWLASRSMRDGKLVDSLPDIAMELPKNLKVKYIVLLCQEGLSSEELKKVPKNHVLFRRIVERERNPSSSRED